MALSLPEILVQPGGEDIAGAATEAGADVGAGVAGGADVAAAAGAGGGLGAGVGAAGLAALPILATILGPELLDAIVGGGGGFDTPAQIAANQARLGGPGVIGNAVRSAFGISPAAGGGLSPSSVVSGEFGALPGGGTGPPLSISAVPGFGPGGAPTPTPRPAQIAGQSSPVGGGGGAGAPGAGGDVPATPVDPSVALGTYEGGVATPANPNVGGQFGTQPAPTPTGSTAGGTTSLFGGGGGNVPWGTLGALGALSVGGQLLAPQLSKTLGLNNVPGSEQLQQTATTAGNLSAQQAAFGQAAEQPLITGVLPPGQQAAVDRATQDAITTIKSKYASLGLSNSTMEADAIAGIQQEALVQQGQLEQQMAQTGASAVSSASTLLGTQQQIYSNIMNAVIEQDQNLSNAISSFASSVGAGTALGATINATKAA